AVVGPNGSGKSTLLHTLAGDLRPVAGTVTLGPRTVRRLYRQDLGRSSTDSTADVAAPVDDRTVLDELLAFRPIGAERARTLLGSLLFSGDEVNKRVGDLSGGERARLLLGRLALEEPTNHLDIPAQEVLETALLHYPGAVVLVTHDRALIDAVATRTWSIEERPVTTGSADGDAPRLVHEISGGYSDLVRIRERTA